MLHLAFSFLIAKSDAVGLCVKPERTECRLKLYSDLRAFFAKYCASRTYDYKISRAYIGLYPVISRSNKPLCAISRNGSAKLL